MGELKACPFCGSAAARSEMGGWFGTGCGGDSKCAAHLFGLMHRSQADADKTWNRRAPDALAVMVAADTPQPPCTVCALLPSEHGSYPTCATHPYTPDGNCQHILGAACAGRECKRGCVRGRHAHGVKGGSQ